MTAGQSFGARVTTPMTKPPLHAGTRAIGGTILKVNHAGEHGAVNIYRAQAQVSRWLRPRLVDELRALQAHEERHRTIFWTEMQRRGQHRCRSYHLCGLGGWLLGAITGILGPAAIASTTVGVERVVLDHLAEQRILLADLDADAYAAVAAIEADERAHHDRAAGAVPDAWIWRRLLIPAVSGVTQCVIWAGMRL